MSIASSILRGFVKTLVSVRRGAAPTLTKGVATPSAPATVQILAAILPARSTDLARTVEGERLRDLVVVYSADLLRAGDDATGAPADLVEFDGFLYEVEDVDAYPGGLFQATARKKVTS